MFVSSGLEAVCSLLALSALIPYYLWTGLQELVLHDNQLQQVIGSDR
jgi:hypothetical protein